jgi:hypothetical protein
MDRLLPRTDKLQGILAKAEDNLNMGYGHFGDPFFRMQYNLTVPRR